MSSVRQLLVLMAVALLALGATGIALAQTDGPDPDSPIKIETPDADDEQDPDDEEDPTADESDSPLEDDEAATPRASGEVPLAAMTLDSNSLPSGWFLYGEGYTSPEEMAESLAGLIDPDELLGTGMINSYQTYYVNADGNSVRTYVFEFETPEGAADGFALIEDEEQIVPNGSYEDQPGLEGIGDGPSEISIGTRSMGDGSTQNSIDISFTIGRYEVGAAMETYDESDPDEELAEDMARDMADRVEAALAGEPIVGIIPSLPDQLIGLDIPVTFEGFQTAAESFFIADPDEAPDGFLSGYVKGGSYSDSVANFLPYVTIGISTFDSAADVEDALQDQDSIMPRYDELEEIDDIEVEGADQVLAFQFASADGEGELDSARIFIQIDDQLISVDIQGEENVETAIAVAQNLANLQITCVLDGDCETAELDG